MFKKLVDYYKSKDDETRYALMTALVQFVVFICLSFCFFIGHYQIPVGFLLGSLIAQLNYFLMCRQLTIMLDDGNMKTKYKAIRNHALRHLIYLVGLVVPVLLYFFKIYVIDAFAVVGAYILPKLVLYIMFGRNSKDKNGQED